MQAFFCGSFLWNFVVDFWATKTAVENALTVFRVRVSQSVMKRQDIVHCTVIHP